MALTSTFCTHWELECLHHHLNHQETITSNSFQQARVLLPQQQLGSLRHFKHQNISSSFQPAQLPQHQLAAAGNHFGFDNISLDNPFINQNHDLGFFYSHDHDTSNYTNCNFLPYLSTPPSDDHSMIFSNLSPENFQLQAEDLEYTYQQSPKRQNSQIFVDQYIPNPPPPSFPEFIFPETPAPQPQVTFNCGRTTESTLVNKNASSTTLSAQSIAARERRRKITGKTQELGKLIPGGHRMNTAEMFQAAYKYVKFLQAQVHVLQLMSSKSMIQERKEQVQTLLVSPIIQEKLYSEGKCLVQKEFVEALANEPQIQSKPIIHH